jgi:ferredoxin
MRTFRCSNFEKSVVFLKYFCYILLMKAQEILKINHEICLKCGGCVAAYSDIFEFDENQKILIKENVEINTKDLPEIKGICPVAAIIEK